MNSTDVKNMELIIELQNEFKRRWKEGGDITAKEIWSLSSDTIKRNIEQYKLLAKQEKATKICEIVDQIFAICNKTDEDEDDSTGYNTIVLTAANRYDDCRYASPADEPFDIIDWDHFGARYNPLYLPANEEIECHKKTRELYNELKHEIASLGIPDAEDFWRESDAVNEVWYGCIGIMNDYKIVAFIVRNDGMLSNTNSIDCTSIYEKNHVSKEYYNHIIMEL